MSPALLLSSEEGQVHSPTQPKQASHHSLLFYGDKDMLYEVDSGPKLISRFHYGPHLLRASLLASSRK